MKKKEIFQSNSESRAKIKAKNVLVDKEKSLKISEKNLIKKIKGAKSKTATKNKDVFFQFFLTALIIFFLVCIISRPAKFLQVSLDGLTAWALCVLPSVLPFMFFTRVLSSLGTLSALSKPFSKISRKLFRTPPISLYAFLMTAVSGYPVGSKMVADLFLQGQISHEDALKMSSFCSTSGPMFIIGAVGVGMFASARVGYILFFSHIFGAVLNGMIYARVNFSSTKGNLKPKIGKSEQNRAEEKLKSAQITAQGEANLSEIVTNSALSVLSVGCIICIFFIIIECFMPLFSLLPAPICQLLCGVVEITKGCQALSTLCGNLPIVLCSFVISFGGISTILQSLTMLKQINMPTKLFVLQKLTHGLLSAIITIVLIVLFAAT